MKKKMAVSTYLIFMATVFLCTHTHTVFVRVTLIAMAAAGVKVGFRLLCDQRSNK